MLEADGLWLYLTLRCLTATQSLSITGPSYSHAPLRLGLAHVSLAPPAGFRQQLLPDLLPGTSSVALAHAGTRRLL